MGTAVTVSYQLNSQGSAPLTLTAPTTSSLTNVAVSNVTTPSSPVAAGSFTTLAVTYTPTAAGPFSFDVSGGTNVPGENPFNFMVSGTGVVSAPAVTSISPASGPTAGGTVVTITGTNLTGASAVKFGTTNATSFTVNSATQITATSPAGAAGTADVTVTTGGGTSATSASDRFTYAAPSSVATLSSLVPSQGTLSPTFASGTTSYTATVANSVTSLTITPTVTDATATVKVNTTTVASGSPSGPIALAVGANTITTVVTAQDGTTTRTYTLIVTRAASVVATTTTLTSSSPTTLVGQGVTLTATITPAPTGGTVTFTEGATTLCNAVAQTSGVATCAASFTTGGAHNVVAAYSGSSTHGASASSSLTVAVTDQTQQTTQTIAGFMSHRNDLIVSNSFDEGREIDRLDQSGNSGDGSGGSNLGEGETAASPSTGASRLGMGDAPNVGGLLANTSGGKGRSGSALADQIAAFTGRTTDNGPQPTGGPVSVTGSGDDTSLRFGFSTSLSAVLKNEAAKEQEKLKSAGDAALGFGGDKTPSQKAAALPFDVWIEGKYTGLTGTTTDGHFGLVTLGADYIVNRRLLVGVFAQYDSLSEKNDTKATKVESQGFMVGPYFTTRLSEHLYWQGRAAWGTSSVDMSPFQTFTDTFATERWMASTKLTGRWRIGPWTLSPAASVSYLSDTSEAYTDSLGATIPSVKSELGQAKIGPEAGYTMAGPNGMTLEPHGKIELVWDFANEARAAGLTVLTNDSEALGDLRGRAELGLRAGTQDGIGLDLSGAYDGIGGSGAGAVSGKAMVRVPLN